MGFVFVSCGVLSVFSGWTDQHVGLFLLQVHVVGFLSLFSGWTDPTW